MPLGPDGRTPTLPTDGGAAGPTDPDRTAELLGRILAGRYQVLHMLGRGGMGIVYEGRHVTVQRRVAIKVLRRDLARSTQAVARFHREAKAAASIGSEHIVEVFDFGYTDEGDAFIAMELLEGEDLGRLVRRTGALPERRAAAIARQIARALEVAHGKGIIHRDLKSENIFVLEREGRDFVKLLDFGISKVSEGDEGTGPVTSEGMVLGTPHYMAPEQVMSAVDTDHRIDLYALGCLLFEMLTGRVPFLGKNPVELVFKHVHEAPTRPSKLRPDLALSPELEAVVLRLLEKDRDKRYANASEVLVALDFVRTSLVEPREAGAPSARLTPPPVSSPVPPADGTTRPSSRRRHALLAASGVAVAVLGAALGPRLFRAGRTAPELHNPRPVAVSGDAGVGSNATALTPALATAATSSAGRDAGATANPGLTIAANPHTAVITVDGQTMGVGLAYMRFPRGSRHRVHVALDGYVPQAREIQLEEPQRVWFDLQRARAGAAPAAPQEGGIVVPASPPRDGGQDNPEDTTDDTDDGLRPSPYQHPTRP